MWARTRRILASCRRIALLLTLCIVAFSAWFYWRAPSLSELRPELESLLKVQLHLKDIRLGQLSWYWAGYAWATADRVSFTSGDERLHVEGAKLAVRLSVWDMLSGRITPTYVKVRQGQVSINLPEGATVTQFALPAMKLALEDVNLSWRYGEMSGALPHLNLLLNGTQRTLAAKFPGADFSLSLSKALVPSEVKAKFRNIDWLPDAFRRYVHGQVGGEFSLRQGQAQQWLAHLALHADDNAALLNQAGHRMVGMDSLEAGLQVNMAPNTFRPEQIAIHQLDWQSGNDALKFSGEWRDGGKLRLKLNSGSLAMGTVWGWLRGLGGEVWQAWLQSMHVGRAEGLEGELQVAHPRLWSLPEMKQLQQARYRLHAKVQGADITLGTSKEQLQQVDGVIDLDEYGLQAHADQGVLPANVGTVKGSITIHDWDHVAFDIQGTGEVDAGRLQSWLGTGALPDLALKHAPSTGLFSFHWLPEEEHPRRGSITLVPSQAWDGELRGIPVQMSGGEVHWSASEGIAIKSMHVQFPIVSGSFDMGLRQDRRDAWRLSRLQADLNADFPKIVAKYRLPLDAPAGTVHGKLSFENNHWQGDADFHDAGWQHLLGGEKKLGEPFVLKIAGEENSRGMQLKTIHGGGAGIQLQGAGRVNANRVYVNLQQLKAPAFDGGMQITVPFDKKMPLEVNGQASFMDRQALPDRIPEAISERPWVLRAKVTRLHWDAVLMQGVDVELASGGHGVGTLQADGLDSSSLHVSNVKAFFRLPGKGRVDLRRLTAGILGQRLTLSAILSPAPQGGLNWQGFANIEGEFSQVIQRLDASKLFKGGTVHALISGKGLLLPNKPWWHHLQGRLRLRADDGRVLEGGTMTKLLAASSLSDLLHYLTLSRKDLSGPGMLYKHLQLEASLDGATAHIRRLAMRASAMDIAGRGTLRLDNGDIDLMTVVRPLQNLDAILGAIPLLRDILGGAGRSLMRLVYHVYGPLPNAKVKQVTPEEAGLAAPGLLESLIALPQRWFSQDVKGQATP